MAEPNYIAGGTIQPSVFVTPDTALSNAVLQASGNSSFIVGVSQEWSKLAPIPNAGSQAADNGDPIKVYSLGEICMLNATSAGWTTGDRLTSDANGNGVTASSTQYYGAVALATLTSAGLGRVQIVTGKNP